MLSGFELYLRWVPLLRITRLCPVVILVQTSAQCSFLDLHIYNEFSFYFYPRFQS